LERILIALLPSSRLTPSALTAAIAQLGLPIKIKVYGFGIVVEGDSNDLRKVMCFAWSLDPQHIFIKPRGFPAIDERFTGREYRGPGYMRRKGLCQLDFELELVEKISEAMGGRRSELKFKIVECRYVRGYVTAFIVEDSGKTLVYCPEMMSMGVHACSGRCPYGEVVVWA